MELQVIINQILTLGIIVLIGFIGVKTKYIEPGLSQSISKTILRITLPLLNLTSITGQTLRIDLLKNAGIVVLVACLVICLLLVTNKLVAKLFRLPVKAKTMHTCMGSFGNVIFLGYPLINALFGAEGLFYAIVYALVNDSFVWSYGVYVIAKSGKGAGENHAKHLINPNTVTFVISLILLCFGVKLPTLMHNTFATVGAMTTPLSMLFIGITLATVDLRNIYKRASIFMIVLIKMLLIPCILICLFNPWNLNIIMVSVLILQIAMPTQTILTVVASDFSSDVQYAAETVFITTVLATVTLPFVYYMIMQLL